MTIASPPPPAPSRPATPPPPLQRSSPGKTLVFVVLGAVVLGIFGYFFKQGFTSALDVFRPFQEAEKARPHRQADGTVCQAPLGFSFPSPGPGFEPSPALETQLGAELAKQNLLAWVYESSATGERIMLQAGKGASKETTFKAFTTGIETSLRKQMSVQSTDFQWNDRVKEYHLTAQAPNNVYLGLRCIASGAGGRPEPLVVCMQTVTRNATDLRQTREGLVIGACGG